MKLSDFRHQELWHIRKAIVQNNPEAEEEIKEALKQKNALASRHLFDVLASRGVVAYDDIVKAQKVVLGSIQNKSLSRTLMLDKTSADIEIKDGSFFVGNTEVEPSYFVSADDLARKGKPIVVVPKDRFETLMIRKRQQTTSNTDETFTLEDVIKEAIRQQASDIHFKFDYHDQYNVSFKIHGSLIWQKQFTLGKNQYKEFFNIVRQKVAIDTGSSFKSEEYNLPQGGRMRYDEFGIDLRSQFTPSGRLDGHNLFVSRILKKEHSTVGTIDTLYGYDNIYRDILWQATFFRRGLKLVVGITNSGKSTLTSHFINSIKPTRSIATVQDPIEYPKNGWHITEHQVLDTGDPATSIQFLDFIKSFKRSDQDVLEIGEIRNDTQNNNGLMDAVVEAVKAGNFVISTAHIHSAFDVPKALMDVFGVDRSVISDLLVLVTAQTLVEELCPHCKIKDTHSRNLETLRAWDEQGNIKFKWKKDLEEFFKDNPVTYLKNEDGCHHCNRTGVKGLTPVYEYYKPSVEMVSWLNENLDNATRFDIEYEFCKRDNPYFSRNKLSVFIQKLREGVVDTNVETIAKVLT